MIRRLFVCNFKRTESVQDLNYLRLLFVCTGNTCRSPMAEAIFRTLASQHFDCSPEKLWDHNVDVLSAGIAAGDSHPASGNAVRVLQERGIDLTQHLSQQLDEKMLEASDVVLTMTKDHRHVILKARPDLADKVRLLSRDERNVVDPIGGSLDDYGQCADMITECLQDILNDFLKKDAEA